ncbi:MAG: PspC domain-containing protein [Xanthomonadales bacterium]|nr:PspC domain-containing protein [Xanthomonadales bacterium]
MRDKDTIDDIKNALNGRPGQPIVFGVCKALAARCGCQPWVTRAVAIFLGLFFTLPALAAYIILGFCLKETEDRTRGFFSGLKVIIQEWIEKLAGASRRAFSDDGYDGSYR